MKKRAVLKSAAVIALAAMLGTVQAQTTPIKFQLDWRFEGPAALFLVPVAKGYFKDAKLEVTVDAGTGSGAGRPRTPQAAPTAASSSQTIPSPSTVTIPGSAAYVGKASTYKVDVPQHGFEIDLTGHNAVSGSFRFEG